MVTRHETPELTPADTLDRLRLARSEGVGPVAYRRLMARYDSASTALTALRTGALSAIATKHLAPERAEALAMVGAGGQALSLVEAVCLVRPITVVRIANRHREGRTATSGGLWQHPRSLSFPLMRV